MTVSKRRWLYAAVVLTLLLIGLLFRWRTAETIPTVTVTLAADGVVTIATGDWPGAAQHAGGGVGPTGRGASYRIFDAAGRVILSAAVDVIEMTDETVVAELSIDTRRDLVLEVQGAEAVEMLEGASGSQIPELIPPGVHELRIRGRRDLSTDRGIPTTTPV